MGEEGHSSFKHQQMPKPNEYQRSKVTYNQAELHFQPFTKILPLEWNVTLKIQVILEAPIKYRGIAGGCALANAQEMVEGRSIFRGTLEIKQKPIDFGYHRFSFTSIKQL